MLKLYTNLSKQGFNNHSFKTAIIRTSKLSI